MKIFFDFISSPQTKNHFYSRQMLKKNLLSNLLQISYGEQVMEDISDINPKVSSPWEKLREQFLVYFRSQFSKLGLHVGLMNKRHLKEKQNNLYILFFQQNLHQSMLQKCCLNHNKLKEKTL